VPKRWSGDKNGEPVEQEPAITGRHRQGSVSRLQKKLQAQKEAEGSRIVSSPVLELVSAQMSNYHKGRRHTTATRTTRNVLLVVVCASVRVCVRAAV